ncbi:hypothetical protein JXA12_00700 [Candidatus Woesearchaeota archaeon]|nr:hypothetical protein [Candidatus Woesearchaeota archaeon]
MTPRDLMRTKKLWPLLLALLITSMAFAAPAFQAQPHATLSALHERESVRAILYAEGIDDTAPITITLQDASGHLYLLLAERTTNTTWEAAFPIVPEQATITAYQGTAELATMTRTFAERTTPQEATVLMATNIKDSDGKALDAKLRLTDKFGRSVNTDKNLIIDLPRAEYTAELTPTKDDALPIDRITFRGLTIKDDFDLGIERLSPTKGFVSLYAIDPTSLDFTDATVTVTATGTTLYKCASWNFTEQTCEGSWSLYQTGLTPGEHYNFTLTPDDPAFGETDTESKPDSCTFTDSYDDTDVDCLAELLTLDSGYTADMDDLETVGTTATMDLIFLNDLYVDTINNVNVTFRYQRQTNSQVGSTTATIQVYDSGGYVTACTDTITIGSWETYTCDLSNYIMTEAEINNVSIRLITDTANSGQPKQVGKTYVDLAYLSADYMERDVTPPTYSNIATQPTTPVAYTGKASWFNVTWNDDFNISVALLEHNFTGSLQNTSMSNESSEYYYSATLAAGSYAWKSYANDTAGLWNKTSQHTYIVNKATPPLTLAFNGTQDDITINDKSLINITGTNGEGIIEILRDGTVIASGTSPITTLETFDTVGKYNITLRHNETQNYTHGELTHTVTVIDTIPPAAVTGLQNATRGVSWITWTWTKSTSTDVAYNEVWRNGTWVANTTQESYNASALNADELYELAVRAVDIHNLTSSFVNDTARTLSSTDTTPPVISNLQHTDVTASSTTINWDTDELATCLIRWGASSGVYTDNATCAQARLNQSIIISGLQPATTHYYRVTATDLVGNDATSPQRSFTTLADTTAPQWSGIAVQPSSPITYSLATTTWFNVTWMDDVEITSAVIEHNFTGSPQNTSMSNESSEYYYSAILGAGSYAWRSHATDGANVNKTPQYSYVVGKAASTIALYLDGKQDNISVAQDATITVNGTTVTPTSGYLYLYYEGSLVDQGNDYVEYTDTYDAPGTYNLTLIFNGDDNHLPKKQTYWLTVNDTIAPNVTLTSPSPGHNDTDGVVVFTYAVDDHGTVANCSLLLNGSVEQTNSSIDEGSNSFTKTDFDDGTYSWNVECYDEEGNNGSGTARTIIIDKQTITIDVPATTTSNWNDADAISIAAINATSGTTESRSIPKGEQRYITWTNYTTAAIPPGATIIDADFNAYHTGTTRTTFEGVEWYNGATYAGTGCAPVQQTGAYRTDSCDLSNYVDTVEEANNISLRYIISAANLGNGGSITIDYLYVTLVYIKETTPPTFTDIHNVTLDIGEPLSAQYGATDLHGIAGWTVNDTRFSITSEGLLTNATPLTEGEYRLLINATDPSDNTAEAYVVITVEDVVDLIITLDTTGLGTSIEIYNESGLVSSSTTSLTDILLANQLYDLVFTTTLSSGPVTATLYGVNLTDDVNFTSDITETYSGTLPDYITSISPLYALDTQSTGFAYAELAIPKAGLDIEYISHCADWNTATDTCNAWEANETTAYDYDENATHFTINVTSFDAFGGGPGDTLPNVTAIRLYDVTGQADTHTGGALIGSGVNTTFDLRYGHEYRAEFDIINEGRKWIINGADVAEQASLNASWAVDTANDIWYGIAGTNYAGGTFSSGTVAWDLSQGGTLDQYENGTWHYVFNITTPPERYYGVTFTVNDTNKNSGSTDRSTYRLLHERELVVNSSSISFSDEEPVEGENITITMTIYNIGIENATDFVIELWDTILDVQVYNETINVSSKSSTTTQYNWTARTGSHTFELRADTPLATSGSITEGFEDNNNHSKQLDVSAWHVLYGSVFEQITLAGQGGTFYAWPLEDVNEGNLYAADADTSITWSSVQALTRDMNNNSSSEDLSEADIALNMTSYQDSVTARYGTDNSTPQQTSSFLVHGKTISNVPVMDSTTTSSFQTGILWDATTDGDGEYSGEEPLIFLTKISPDTLGTYGTYDYEMAIPSSLQKTMPGSDTTYLYLEIT